MPEVMCNFRIGAFFLFAWLVICRSPTARKYRPTQSSMTGCELKITHKYAKVKVDLNKNKTKNPAIFSWL